MESDTKLNIKIGICVGDPNGIGPEVILKALEDARIFTDFTPIIYGPTKVFNHLKTTLKSDDFSYVSIKKAEEFQGNKINIINYPKDDYSIQEGMATTGGANVAFWALESAVTDLEKGTIDAIVTGPFSKHVQQTNGFNFPGHTEYLDAKFSKDGALMILCADKLKVALVTNHVPIKDVAANISKDLVLSKIKTLNLSLMEDFNVQRPKIAVLGLNPHAGENGIIGQEEMESIAPAISAAKSNQILAFGPYSADAFFGTGACFSFDAVLAMYHDQGLTGFKAISFDQGVNFTAGLTKIRTSPGHGTAFDIAGKGIADEGGMRNAIYQAIDIVKNRSFYTEISKNPLPISKGTKEMDVSSS